MFMSGLIGTRLQISFLLSISPTYLKRVFCAAPGSVMSFSWLKRTDMILETKLKRRTSRSAWMKSSRRKASASPLKPATSFVDFTVICDRSSG